MELSPVFKSKKFIKMLKLEISATEPHNYCKIKKLKVNKRKTQTFPKFWRKLKIDLIICKEILVIVGWK